MRRLILACLLTNLFAATALAEGPSPFVLIYTYGDKGAGQEIAYHLEDQIGKGLLDKCVDWTTERGLQALVDWEGMSAWLGKKTNQDQMTAIAQAVGARYVMAVLALVNPDGSVSLSVTVYDLMTEKAIAYGRETAPDAESSLAKARSLAKSMVQDLASRFKSQCDEHWSGTISHTFKRENRSQKSDSSPAGSWPGQAGKAVNTSDYARFDVRTDAMQVVLQPLSLGSQETNQPMASTYRKFEFRLGSSHKSTTWIKCGAFGRGMPNPMRQTNREESHLITELGSASLKKPVYILIDKNTGKYTIRFHYPSVAKKRHEERSDSNPGNRCNPDPISSANDSEEAARQSTNIIELSGQVDPENPVFLSGNEVTGDLEKGQTTKIWNLRLVKTKRRP